MCVHLSPINLWTSELFRTQLAFSQLSKDLWSKEMHKTKPVLSIAIKTLLEWSKIQVVTTSTSSIDLWFMPWWSFSKFTSCTCLKQQNCFSTWLKCPYIHELSFTIIIISNSYSCFLTTLAVTALHCECIHAMCNTKCQKII